MIETNLLERLRGLLKLAEKHTESSFQARLEAYLVLYRLSRQDIIWRDIYRSWDALLTGEKVPKGPWSHFKAGFVALQADEAKARRLGYTTIVYLGRVKTTLRAWTASRLETEPARQVFDELETRKAKVPGENRTRAELAQYVQILKKALKKNRIRLPKPPWVG